MLIHFVGGFGRHKGKSLKPKELLAFDAAKACYPAATIYAWTDCESWQNLPDYAERKDVNYEFYGFWPNVKLVKGAHMSDKVRLFALLTFGGLYLDTDVYCMQPADFHDSKLQMPNESFHNNKLTKLNNGIIYAPQPDNRFLNMWWDAYGASIKQDFSKYVTMSCELPVQFAAKYPGLIDIQTCKQWLGDSSARYRKPFVSFPRHLNSIVFWHLRRSAPIDPEPGSNIHAILTKVCETWGLQTDKYGL